jgi:UDP-N-acetylmuramyl tripeptide synthase
MRISSVSRYCRSARDWFKATVYLPVRHRTGLEVARCYRTLLGYTTNMFFVAVTGSCGKTTTTELTTAILAREGRAEWGFMTTRSGISARRFDRCRRGTASASVKSAGT